MTEPPNWETADWEEGEWDRALRRRLLDVSPPEGFSGRLAARLGASDEGIDRPHRRWFLGAAVAGAAACAATFFWPRRRWSTDDLVRLAERSAEVIRDPDADWRPPDEREAQLFPGDFLTAPPDGIARVAGESEARLYRLNLAPELALLCRAAVAVVDGPGVDLPLSPPQRPQHRSGGFVAAAWGDRRRSCVLVLLGPSRAYGRLVTGDAQSA